MTKRDINLKRQRIKISNINEFINQLKNENYNINLSIDTEENFRKEILSIFNIESYLCEQIYKCLKGDITYKVSDIKDFINYIDDIVTFEKEHNKLLEKINKIKKLNIYRVEYERVPSTQDDVEDILKEIDEIKELISNKINDEGKLKLQTLEDEIDNNYVYAKDIELLKNIILSDNENVKEEYDDEKQIRKLYIEVPKNIGYSYIKALKGSVEYHKHIKSYIPRIKRLIKNLDKYIVEDNEKGTYKINQSIAIQDSVNMAIAVFNNKEFRAVSGKNDIENSCRLIPSGKEYFKSCKVNKLGKLGIGYNRVNDSEKKILEKIHKDIQEGKLSDVGTFTLYSKWEPCTSCYYVISQFCKKYPNISVQVKYNKKYGEK